MLAEDAEARRIDVEFGGDRGAAGEMFAAEFHRGTTGGVAHRTGEGHAGFAGDGSRVQDETDRAGGGGAGILGRDFHTERSEVVEERIERDAFGAEGATERGLQRDFTARVGGLFADDEAGPRDAGAEVGLTA